METETPKERTRRQNKEWSRESCERKRQNEAPERRTKRKPKQFANETCEQRTERLALRRWNSACETEEQRKARLAGNVERRRKQLANETLEQRAARIARQAESARKYLANESSKQRATRLARQAESKRKYLANESSKQRATRLARHAEKNLEQRTCEECGKSLSTSTALQRHMGIHAEQKKFNCKEPGCEKSFTSLFRYNLHMATHAGDTIECEDCGKRYAGKECLRRHRLRMHSTYEERKFKCDHCEKTFAIPTDCRSHIFKTHSKE